MSAAHSEAPRLALSEECATLHHDAPPRATSLSAERSAKLCRICRAEPVAPRRKCYCSSLCALAGAIEGKAASSRRRYATLAYREAARQRYHEGLARGHNPRRTYYLAHADDLRAARHTGPRPKRCARVGCGAPIPYVGRGRPPKYCSALCKVRQEVAA